MELNSFQQCFIQYGGTGGAGFQGPQGTFGTQGIEGLQGPEGIPGVSPTSIGLNFNTTEIADFAGSSNQGLFSVAIGYSAGQSDQGQDAIAIGKEAGKTLQPANSIVVNATGSELSPSTAGFFVAPITNNTTTDILYYDSSTKEITYGVGGAGVQGPQGDAGVQGYMGLQGYQGSAGGSSVVYAYNVASAGGIGEDVVLWTNSMGATITTGCIRYTFNGYVVGTDASGFSTFIDDSTGRLTQTDAVGFPNDIENFYRRPFQMIVTLCNNPPVSDVIYINAQYTVGSWALEGSGNSTLGMPNQITKCYGVGPSLVYNRSMIGNTLYFGMNLGGATTAYLMSVLKETL